MEIAFAREGYTPEVSYGTHFFQDLVEADIAMMPLYPDAPECMLREDFLLGSDNSLSRLDESLRDLSGVIHVIQVPAARAGRMLHVYLDEEKQEGMGIFGTVIEAG